MQPMMGMAGMPMQGMQMGMTQQQMAGMPQMGQMAMAPMNMGTPMGMMPAMGMMQMGVPMQMGMPMGMMGMNPMMMMQSGAMPGQMGGGMAPMAPQDMGMGMAAMTPQAMGASMAAMAPQDMGASMAVLAAQVPVPQVSLMPRAAPLQAAQEDVRAASLPQPSSASAGSQRSRRRRDGEDSDEEMRGMQALRNVGSAAAHSKEAKKSSGGEVKATEGSGADPGNPAASLVEVKKKKCHLHMKPNPSCKVCRRIKDENAAMDADMQTSKSTAKDVGDKDEGSKKDKDQDEQRTFKSSPMLKDQILKSSYFKSLLDITTVEGLIEEIDQYADTLAVYNAGSATNPSCFICQVYRLFTMPNVEDELQVILHADSSVVKCVGFVYIRLVFEPTRFWGMLEEHLFDDMELKYQDTSGKTVTMNIGEYVEALLIKEKYFGTPLPRIPVKVRSTLEERLAPLPSYRKRMQANRKVFNERRNSDTPVEVYLDNNEWVSGLCVELFGRSTTFVKLRVKLEDGMEITSHLGRVVLRSSSRDDSGSESGSEGKKKRKKQRRSRSRGKKQRGGSPDWSRFKGKSHGEMLEELRAKAKEDAVEGHGKVYPRRPQTFEGFANSYESTGKEEPHGRPHAQPRSQQKQEESKEEDSITRRLRQQDEDERRRQQQSIFEKYGKQARPDASSGGYSDMDRADVLRFG